MGRPREHDETTATALLEAAESLLATGGIDAVSVRATASAADVSTRAVYASFGGKNGLLLALASRGYLLLAERVRGVQPTDDPAADLVTAGIEGFRGFALEHPGLFRLTFERVPAAVATNEETGRASLESYDALCAWVTRAHDAGVLDGRPVNEIAFVFHSCCLGLATSELSRQPPPVGSGFWQPVEGVPGLDLWNTGLRALVTGLSTGQR